MLIKNLRDYFYQHFCLYLCYIKSYFLLKKFFGAVFFCRVHFLQ